MAAEPKKYKFPKTMAACADRYYELREKRLAMAKEVAAVEAEEKALKDYLINTLPKSEASGVAGKLARVTVVTKAVPQVVNWDDFYKYIKRTGEFDLLNKAVSKTAVEARWDNKKKVPGVEPFTVVTLSVNKV